MGKDGKLLFAISDGAPPFAPSPIGGKGKTLSIQPDLSHQNFGKHSVCRQRQTCKATDGLA
jgi:hypothetical protein